MAVVPDVDADGKPETPTTQIADKQKQKHMATLGLIIGGAGLALVILFHKKGSGSTSQTATSAGTTGGLGAGDVYSPGGAGSGYATGAFSAGETSIMSTINQNKAQSDAQALALAEQQQDIGVQGNNLAMQNADIITLLTQGPNAKLPYTQGTPLPYKGYVPNPNSPMGSQNPFFGSASGATP